MKKLLLILVLIMPVAVSAQTTAEQAATAVFAAFLDSMTKVEIDKVVGLFTEDALFWGTSMQTLATDLAGVQGYFAALSGREPGQNVARAVDYKVKVVSAELTLLSGTWQVVPASGGAVTNLRISMALVLRDGDWKIAQFHNSMLP